MPASMYCAWSTEVVPNARKPKEPALAAALTSRGVDGPPAIGAMSIRDSSWRNTSDISARLMQITGVQQSVENPRNNETLGG